MSEGTDHLTDCTDDDCDLCSHYLEFCMACEGCGSWGQMASDGWVLFVGIPFCMSCAEDPEVYKPGRVTPYSITGITNGNSEVDR